MVVDTKNRIDPTAQSTSIGEEATSSKKDRSRSRSREKKEVKVERVDANNRRAILLKMKQRRIRRSKSGSRVRD